MISIFIAIVSVKIYVHVEWGMMLRALQGTTSKFWHACDCLFCKMETDLFILPVLVKP